MTKSNSVWFITGASKGLGLVLARRLARAGVRVAATSRSKAALQEALGDDRETVLALEVDLLDEASVGRAVEETVARFGRIDVVVNNAGYGQLGAVEELSADEVRRNFDVNVFAVTSVLRATLPHLRRQRSGHVLNIASVGGFVGGFAGWSVYCATKFALAGLSEGLHAEMAEHGVKVTVVYPGYFRTEFLSAGSVGRPAHPIEAYAAVRSSEAQHVGAIDQNQPGDPEKLAAALMEVTASAEPPLHLFLGPDAFARAEDKLAQVRAQLDAHAALSRSTDLDR